MTAQNLTIDEPVLLGNGPSMEWLRAAATRVAGGGAKVLITGESGVGKDLVARFIHARSPRTSRAFVALNCAGISETLLESELFGHVRGSFTGAHRDKVGLFQLADKGTVFLDEVGEMSLRMQALLLRFLENGEVKPVGSDRVSAKVDVRVIAATNRNLADLVARGLFREDLMYRIMVVHLEVPPLRNRSEDIRDLVTHIIDRGSLSLELSADAMSALEAYHWPGNVRELQNLIEQLAWLHGGGYIDEKDLPPHLVASASGGLVPSRERRKRVSDQSVRRTRHGRVFVLGAHLPDVHQSRYHASGHHDDRPASAPRNQRELSCRPAGARDAARRLQAVPQLSLDARLQRRLPRVPLRPRLARAPDGSAVHDGHVRSAATRARHTARTQ